MTTKPARRRGAAWRTLAARTITTAAPTQPAGLPDPENTPGVVPLRRMPAPIAAVLQRGATGAPCAVPAAAPPKVVDVTHASVQRHAGDPTVGPALAAAYAAGWLRLVVPASVPLPAAASDNYGAADPYPAAYMATLPTWLDAQALATAQTAQMQTLAQAQAAILNTPPATLPSLVPAGLGPSKLTRPTAPCNGCGLPASLADLQETGGWCPPCAELVLCPVTGEPVAAAVAQLQPHPYITAQLAAARGLQPALSRALAPPVAYGPHLGNGVCPECETRLPGGLLDPATGQCGPCSLAAAHDNGLHGDPDASYLALDELAACQARQVVGCPECAHRAQAYDWAWPPAPMAPPAAATALSVSPDVATDDAWLRPAPAIGPMCAIRAHLDCLGCACTCH